MYRRIDDFLNVWKYEAGSTAKIFDALTDASLTVAVNDDHRTIARMAWHIAGTIPEMMNQTGLSVNDMSEQNPIPSSAADIATAFRTVSDALAEQIKSKWEDATLEKEDNLYDETWKRGQTLHALVAHQSHHRGQMTVLMRQAGLNVPGIYGPAKEEWTSYNMPVPPV